MRVRMYSGHLPLYKPIPITDTGPGFNAEVSPKVWNRYLKALKEFEAAVAALDKNINFKED